MPRDGSVTLSDLQAPFLSLFDEALASGFPAARAGVTAIPPRQGEVDA